MSTRTVLIQTDDNGDFIWQRRVFGEIKAIKITVGTLEAFDLVIDDAVLPEREYLNLSGVTDNAVYEVVTGKVNTAGEGIEGAVGPAIVGDTLRVTVSNGGGSRHGSIVFLGL